MINPCPKNIPVRLKGKAKSEFRRKVYTEKGPACNNCGGFAPLYVEDYTGMEVYIEGKCGEVSHIKSTGSGGPDTMYNVNWECWYCHRIGKHGPRWSSKEHR